MGSFSAVHWLIVGVVALLLFGGGARLAGIGTGLGQGIKNFKKGMKDDDDDARSDDEDAKPAKRISARTVSEDEDEAPAPKKLKKKVVTVEVDEDDDEAAIARKVARSKKVASVED